MFRSKIKLIFLSILVTVILSSTILVGLYTCYVPDDPISLAVFKKSYSLFPFKKSFLEFYSPAKKSIGGNRTTIDVNEFLLQRIETTNDESEIAAIAHYYSLQAKVREYDVFIHSSNRVKPLIINQLIKEFDDDNSSLSDKIMLLETTRTSRRIGKGSIWIVGENFPNFSSSTQLDEIEKWRNESLASTNVKQKYREWWNSNSSWEEKKKINPLEGTNIKVSECCG